MTKEGLMTKPQRREAEPAALASASYVGGYWPGR